LYAHPTSRPSVAAPLRGAVGKSPQHRRGIPQATASASFNASSAGLADHHGRSHRHSATGLQEWRNTPQGHETAGVRRRQRRLTSADNYSRKLKPTPKKTRKIRQKTKKTLKNPRKIKGMQKLQIKEEIMAVAALLALGMLAIMPGLIAGSALTTSTKQVPNVVTQVSFAYCGYSSGW